MIRLFDTEARFKRCVALGMLWLGSLMSACTLGPDYVRPSAAQPAGYKEMQGWVHAQPQDGQVPANWWRAYGDTTLDGLEARVLTANQSLAQAVAAYQQERALVEVARAQLFPLVGVDASVSRSRQLGQTASARSLELEASWEPDLWGSVARTVEESRANAAASAATLANTLLSLQSELAIDYFQLRGADATAALYQQTIEFDQKLVQFTMNQYRVGVAQQSDIVSAQTTLATDQAQAADLGVQRTQLEHAIAVLVGVPPAGLSLQFNPLSAAQLIPPPPVAVPSTLLQRRPDVALAERQVAAANAQIGIDTAAYYPSLGLSAAGGLSAAQAVSFFSAPARVWSVGSTLAESLFDGGARSGQLASARAAYDASVANYRATVLSAFQSVEDNLSGLRILENEYNLQAQAVALSQKALELEVNRYQAGSDAYSAVLTAQATLLTNQRQQVTLLSERVVYNVQLVKALGGGWTDHQLENPLAYAGSTDPQSVTSDAGPSR